MISLFQYYRIFCAYLILLIHQSFFPCNGTFLGSLSGLGVPLFASMAGYLYNGGLRKKVSRILVPYFIWAVIYFIMNNVILDMFVRHEAFEFPGLRSWLLGGTASHLWFLPCLFAAFAVIECLRGVIRLTFSSGIDLSSMFANLILFVFGVLSQWLPGETSVTLLGYCRIYFGRLLLFFALGGIIKHLHLSFITYRLSLIEQIMGGGAIMLGLANFALHFVTGLAWQPLLLVAGLMLLAINVGEFKVPKFVEDFANATMGIYLVHVLLVNGMALCLNKSGVNSLPPTIGFSLTIFAYFASYFSVRCLHSLIVGLKGRSLR